jgi:hypothetical protein
MSRDSWMSGFSEESKEYYRNAHRERMDELNKGSEETIPELYASFFALTERIEEKKRETIYRPETEDDKEKIRSISAERSTYADAIADLGTPKAITVLIQMRKNLILDGTEGRDTINYIIGNLPEDILAKTSTTPEEKRASLQILAEANRLISPTPYWDDLTKKEKFLCNIGMILAPQKPVSVEVYCKRYIEPENSNENPNPEAIKNAQAVIALEAEEHKETLKIKTMEDRVKRGIGPGKPMPFHADGDDITRPVQGSFAKACNEAKAIIPPMPPIESPIESDGNTMPNGPTGKSKRAQRTGH